MWSRHRCSLYRVRYPSISDLRHFTGGREEANIASLPGILVLLSWNLCGGAEGTQKQKSWLHATTYLTSSSPLSIFRIEELARSRNGVFPNQRGVMEAWSSCARQQSDSWHGIVAKPALSKRQRWGCCLDTFIMPPCVQERGTTAAKPGKPNTQQGLSAYQQENTAEEGSQQRLLYQRKSPKIWRPSLGVHHKL